jgi:predicted transcriptional regulator
VFVRTEFLSCAATNERGAGNPGLRATGQKHNDQDDKYDSADTEVWAILWKLRSASVVEVHRRFGRPIGPTTIGTVLSRLLEKQLVARRPQGIADIYHALIPPEIVHKAFHRTRAEKALMSISDMSPADAAALP